jgi:hypothetical protein
MVVVDGCAVYIGNLLLSYLLNVDYTVSVFVVHLLSSLSVVRCQSVRIVLCRLSF